MRREPTAVGSEAGDGCRRRRGRCRSWRPRRPRLSPAAGRTGRASGGAGAGGSGRPSPGPPRFLEQGAVELGLDTAQGEKVRADGRACPFESRRTGRTAGPGPGSGAELGRPEAVVGEDRDPLGLAEAGAREREHLRLGAHLFGPLGKERGDRGRKSDAPGSPRVKRPCFSRTVSPAARWRGRAVPTAATAAPRPPARKAGCRGSSSRDRAPAPWIAARTGSCPRAG